MKESKFKYPVKGQALIKEIRSLISSIRSGNKEAEELLKQRCRDFPGYEKRVYSVSRNMGLREGNFTVARPEKTSGDWRQYRK